MKKSSFKSHGNAKNSSRTLHKKTKKQAFINASRDTRLSGSMKQMKSSNSSVDILSKTMNDKASFSYFQKPNNNDLIDYISSPTTSKSISSLKAKPKTPIHGSSKHIKKSKGKAGSSLRDSNSKGQSQHSEGEL